MSKYTHALLLTDTSYAAVRSDAWANRLVPEPPVVTIPADLPERGPDPASPLPWASHRLIAGRIDASDMRGVAELDRHTRRSEVDRKTIVHRVNGWDALHTYATAKAAEAEQLRGEVELLDRECKVRIGLGASDIRDERDEARARIAELEAACSDEEAAHKDTLRLWKEAKSRVTELEERLVVAEDRPCERHVTRLRELETQLVEWKAGGPYREKCRLLDEANAQLARDREQMQAAIDEAERLRRDRGIGNGVMGAIREALFDAGHCGDGNLVEMVKRALAEAEQRGRDHETECGRALVAASSKFPDEWEGTVAERVIRLRAELGAIRDAAKAFIDALPDEAVNLSPFETQPAHAEPLRHLMALLSDEG